MPKLAISNFYSALSFTASKLEVFFEKLDDLYELRNRGTLSVVFLDREYHSQMHGRFLKDFRPTDVITFPADEEEGSVGEICVSVDQAILEAENRKLSFSRELSLYLIHGWLHLVGYDDLDEVDRKVMRREEDRSMKFIEQKQAWPDFLLA